MIEVRQSDKESAHLLAGKVMMLTGVQLIGDAVAQAFYEVMAAHRQQAEDAMREKCATYMDARAERLFAESTNKSTGNMMRTVFQAEATAIRGIDAGGEGK